LSNALAALAPRMEAKQTAGVAARAAPVLVKALANQKETNPSRFSNFSSELGALMPWMEARKPAGPTERLLKALARLASRMEAKEAAGTAQRLVKALEDQKETSSSSLSDLGTALGALAPAIPSARGTQLFALSNTLLRTIPGRSKDEKEEPQLRKIVVGLSALLSSQDLAEVLKWPFCVGEAEKIVLAELEKKTGKVFGGSVWKFVDQAPALGIKNLDQPAKRPSAERALKELETLRTGAASK